MKTLDAMMLTRNFKTFTARQGKQQDFVRMWIERLPQRDSRRITVQRLPTHRGIVIRIPVKMLTWLKLDYYKFLTGRYMENTEVMQMIAGLTA